MSDKVKSKSKDKDESKNEKGSKSKNKEEEKLNSSKDKKDKSDKKESSKKLRSSKKLLVNPLEENITDIKQEFSDKNLTNQTTIQQTIINSNIEYCDGCFKAEGNSFCTNCQKVYCLICESKIHIVPIYKSHER